MFKHTWVSFFHYFNYNGRRISNKFAYYWVCQEISTPSASLFFKWAPTMVLFIRKRVLYFRFKFQRKIVPRGTHGTNTISNTPYVCCYKSTLLQAVVWCQTGNKPSLPEPMLTKYDWHFMLSIGHICDDNDWVTSDNDDKMIAYYGYCGWQSMITIIRYQDMHVLPRYDDERLDDDIVMVRW